MSKKKSRATQTYRLVLIEWDDAAGAPDDKLGWIKIAEAKEHVDLITIRSVGWLINDKKKSYTLVPNITSDAYCDAATVIPKAWVKSIKDLNE